MKNITDFTKDIRNKIPLYKEKAIKNLYNGTENENWKREDTVNYIEYIYKLGKQKDKPVVIIAENIKQYKLYYNLLFQKPNEFTKTLNLVFLAKNKRLKKNEVEIFKKNIKSNKIVNDDNTIKCKYHYLFLTYEYSRVYLMWYKFIKDEFNLPSKKSKELDWLYENINKANISRGFLCKKVALILRMPKKIIRNDIGFHCSSYEGAIQYSNQKIHYLNGRKIPNWVFDKYFDKSLNFDDFIKEENEDIKAGIITLIKENEGNEGILKFLNAQLVDEKVITHYDKITKKEVPLDPNCKIPQEDWDSLGIETKIIEVKETYSEIIKLYKTKESYSFLLNSKGKNNQPYAWINMKCPSTGQEYLIDTCPTFNDAIKCAAWHRPKNIPLSLPYIWQSAN